MAKKTTAKKVAPAQPSANKKSALGKPVANSRLAGKPASVKAAGKATAKTATTVAVGPKKSAGKSAAATQVEWSYLRANCKTCEKAEAWLDKAGIAIGPRVDARKQTIGAAEGLKLAKGVAEVRVAKGSAVTKLDMKKGAPGEAELGKLIIGPTGNLRAPTLRHGNTLVVGFNEQLYGEFFGG